MKSNVTGKGLIGAAAAAWMVAATPVLATDGEAVFNQTCKMCHGSGMGGAPKFGDAAAWEARIAKGIDVLYANAINGFRGKGIMPPRGGNKNLTDDEVKAAVDYMVHAAQ